MSVITRVVGAVTVVVTPTVFVVVTPTVLVVVVPDPLGYKEPMENPPTPAKTTSRATATTAAFDNAMGDSSGGRAIALDNR
jgi:hypothetical protein